MNKKIILICFIILLLFASIIALTQEMDEIFPQLNGETETEDESENAPDIVKIIRWFKSNSAGMALAEIQSQFVALREEYALAVTSAHKDELPEYLLQYFSDDLNIEVRILYKKGEQLRTQWLFLDIKGNTKLNGVFLEKKDSIDYELTDYTEEVIVFEDESSGSIEESDSATAVLDEINETGETAETESDESEYIVNIAVKDVIKDEFSNIKGFIEIFNQDSNLSCEYQFFENNRRTKIDFLYKDNILINSSIFLWDTETGDYNPICKDTYIYNRSLSLRAIERVFYIDVEITADDISRVTFPRNIKNVAAEKVQIRERLNVYPEYFGEMFIFKDSKMVYDTDARGRILSQTLYDSENEIIWVINNIWNNDRIVSAVKKEKDRTLLVEYVYNSKGDRITERNYTDGILERVVRIEGDLEIEELYMDSVIVLTAIWENGIKITESRNR